MAAGRSVAPAQGFYDLVDVFLEIIDDGCEGVVVRSVVEEESAAQEVLGAVGKPELVGGAGILAADLDDGGIDVAVGVGEVQFLFAGRLAVVERKHAGGGVDERVEVVEGAEVFVGEVDDAFVLRIDEVEILGASIVLLPVDDGFGRALEGEGERCGVVEDIVFRRHVHTDVGFGFRHIVVATATRKKKRETDGGKEEEKSVHGEI